MYDKAIEELVNRLSQDASYKFGDLVMSYPEGLRALVMAVVQSCITANLGTMPKEERELFEAAKSRMVVMTIPAELDPRKHGGQKHEN
jgi:ribulose 1,5-bisphosphate carboxylase large subunit-like protein